jgi:hypothetical protein
LRPPLKRTLSLVYPKERFRSKVVLTFVEFARNKLQRSCLPDAAPDRSAHRSGGAASQLPCRAQAIRRLEQQREAKAWAVVKANAYGHGLLRAAAALGDVADGFALLDLDEAVALRQAGYPAADSPPRRLFRGRRSRRLCASTT